MGGPPAGLPEDLDRRKFAPAGILTVAMSCLDVSSPNRKRRPRAIAAQRCPAGPWPSKTPYRATLPGVNNVAERGLSIENRLQRPTVA